MIAESEPAWFKAPVLRVSPLLRRKGASQTGWVVAGPVADSDRAEEPFFGIDTRDINIYRYLPKRQGTTERRINGRKGKETMKMRKSKPVAVEVPSAEAFLDSGLGNIALQSAEQPPKNPSVLAGNGYLCDTPDRSG